MRYNGAEPHPFAAAVAVRRSPELPPPKAVHSPTERHRVHPPAPVLAERHQAVHLEARGARGRSRAPQVGEPQRAVAVVAVDVAAGPTAPERAVADHVAARYRAE